MKRAIFTITLLILTSAAGVAWKQIHDGRKAAAAAASLAAENARAMAEIRKMEARLAAAERECTARRASLVTTSAAESGAKGSPSSEKAVDVAAIYRKARDREKDPQVQAIRLASRRAQLLATHGVFFRKRGLTASQIERFQDIAARRNEQNLDLNGILEGEAEKNGTVSPETKSAVEKIRAQVNLEAETARKELLGEDGYKALLEYNRTVSTRRLVGDMAGAAVVAGVPWTAEQAEQLTQILANTSVSYREGGSANTAKIDWQRGDEQARGILSAPQMEFIQTAASPLCHDSRFNVRLDDAMTEITKADAQQTLAATEKSNGG